MKGWFKLLVLAAIPILVVTMVVDQGQAANPDKGSQLIFIADMDMTNFISITNTSVDIPDLDTMDVEGSPTDTDGGVDVGAETAMAVTVLVQIYDESITPVVEYLRVITGGSTVLLSAFDHMIPGTEENVSAYVGGGDGSRYVIAVTPVRSATALFPDYLAEDMHETQNIDAIGDGEGLTLTGDHATDEALDADEDAEDATMKNVGDLTVENSQPAAFNYLTGHQTTAQTESTSGGSDQTASWAMNALTRMAMVGTAGVDPGPGYEILSGSVGEDNTANRLQEVIHGGDTTVTNTTMADGYVLIEGGNAGEPDTEKNTEVTYGGVNWGALVWASLHSPAAHQEVQLISVADDYGKDGEFGDYKLIPARTKYKVVPHDAMGRVYMAPDADDPPVFRGGDEEDMEAPSPDIAVSGISVMIDPGDCGGMMVDGGFSLADLMGQVPGIGAGNDDFTGVNSMVDPMMEAMNRSMGWIKFLRHTQKCEVNYGDMDGAYLTASEDPDGIPVDDKRTLTTGTLVMEPEDNRHTMTDRIFVTGGYVMLVFETPDATFGAAWNLTDK